MKNNPAPQISTTVSATQMAAIKTALETIQNNMPFLHSLTEEEHASLHTIKQENRIFTENTIHVLVNNPELQPANFNVKEKLKAMMLYSQLEELLFAVKQMAKKISDIQLLVGEETYLDALTSYRQIENSAKKGLSEVDATYELLNTSYQNQAVLALEKELVVNGYMGTW